MSRRKLIQELWAEHRFALQAFFRRRIRSTRDAADLTQEVYFRLLRTGDDRAIQNPEAYLFTVARNLLTEHAVLERRQSRRISFEDPLVGAELTFEPTVESELDHDIQVIQLRKAIEELNEPQKAALLMAYQDGLSYSEIAKRLDVHKSMVGKYLEQAINLCRKRLNRSGAV